MNELILINNGVAFLDSETSKKIAEFENLAKKVKESEEALKAAIAKEMKEKGIVKLETPELLLSRIEATTRETFDSKAFKADFPEMYDGYVKMSPVKESLRVKLK